MLIPRDLFSYSHFNNVQGKIYREAINHRRALQLKILGQAFPNKSTQHTIITQRLYLKTLTRDDVSFVLRMLEL